MSEKENARGADKTTITKEQLDKELRYIPDEGYFVRLKSKGGSKAGTKAGSVHKYLGYVEIKVNGKAYYAHRLAHLTMTGAMPTHQIDHANGYKADNRWTNLRAATPSQNGLNKPGWSSSGHKCITAYDTKSFGQRYRVDVIRNDHRYQEVFGSLDQAVAYRDAVIRKHDGEFTNTSHINDL